VAAEHLHSEQLDQVIARESDRDGVKVGPALREVRVSDTPENVLMHDLHTIRRRHAKERNRAEFVPSGYRVDSIQRWWSGGHDGPWLWETAVMIEQFLDIVTPDSTPDTPMVTFVVHPEEGGPHPVVLFFMDAPGMREEIRDMARRLASAGYYVMAPQLYYREVAEYNLFETGDRGRMQELMGNLGNKMVLRDSQALLAHADDDDAASTARVGAVGYCMSGPFAVYLLGQIPNQVVAAASFHGVRLVADSTDSPHLQLANARGEVYVGAAEVDSYAPPEMIDAFEAARVAADCAGRTEWYPGTEHGFAFSERPMYVKEASERHWERLHDLFDRTLRDPVMNAG